jgi:hypothetical protein
MIEVGAGLRTMICSDTKLLDFTGFYKGKSVCELKGVFMLLYSIGRLYVVVI